MLNWCIVPRNWVSQIALKREYDLNAPSKKHLVCYGRNYNEANEAKMPHTEIDNCFLIFLICFYIQIFI